MAETKGLLPRSVSQVESLGSHHRERRARAGSCCGSCSAMLQRDPPFRLCCAKSLDEPIHAPRQYSSGKSSVVADRSASVIIHSFSPASVW